MARHDQEREFSDELRSHLELHVADNIRAGMTPEEARRRALIALGGVEQTREQYRDAFGLAWLDALVKDVQFGVRTMRRSAGFTMLAIVTLAIGIAATNTAFTIVNTVLLRDLPFDRADRIVAVGIRDADGDPRMSFADFRDWERTARSFDALGAFDQTNMNISDDQRAPEQFEGAYVSAGTFRVLRVRPVLGRDFTNDDDRPGAPPVVILGHGMWQSRYGGDSSIVGRAIRVNAQPVTVIGIMPEGFEFPFNHKVWQPLSMIGGLSQQARDARSLDAIGRLADGVSAAEAATQLNAINAAIARDFPDTNARTRAEVVQFRPGIGGPWYIILSALMTAVGLLLLVSCANVANLLLARSLQRGREVSIRASLGATRWRVVRQLLVESVMLSVAAGLFALILSWAGIQILLSFVEEIGKPAWMDFSMNATVFLFLASVCVGAGILFGVVPALYISRGGSEMLKQSTGRTATAGVWARRAAGALVIAEVILTVVLVAGAVSMTRHLQAQSAVSRTIDTSSLLTLNVNLRSQTYPSGQERVAFVRRLEERLGFIASGASIAIADSRPYMGATRNGRVSIDGQTVAPGERLPAVQAVTVGSRYFEVLGLPVMRGRTITSEDGAPGSEAAVVVNERFVEQFLPDVEPLGHVMLIQVEDDAPRRVAIVGVARTLRRDELQSPVSVVYVPYQLHPTSGVILLARSEMSAAALAAQLREQVRALDPDLPLFNIRTLEDALSELLWVNRVFGGMFAIFAAMAVLIATVGIYGVVAFTMTQRTQEIGIRSALGAPLGHLWWTMMRSKIAQIGIGLSVGVVAAFLLLRLMGGLLVGRFGQDPVTFAASAVFLFVVSIAAMLWPIQRATSGNPVAALRYE